MQPRYSPHENDRLPWESAPQSVEELQQGLPSHRGKLALVLLVGARDADDCCAQNFERTLFRHAKIVSFVGQFFLPYRYDRAGPAGIDFFKTYELKEDKPALLILDIDGDLLDKRQDCTQPAAFIKVLMEAVRFSRKKIAYSAQVTRSIERAEERVGKGEFREALIALFGLRTDQLSAKLRAKAKRLNASIEEAAAAAIAEAEQLEQKQDLEKAYALYKHVYREFSRIKEARERGMEGAKRVRELLDERERAEKKGSS